MLPNADKTLQQITKAGIQLLLEEPFFAHLLSSLPRQVDDQIPTIGWAIQEDYTFVLQINPAFWQQITDPLTQIGVLKHELLHLLFLHPLRKMSFSKPNYFDLAADLVVNQYIGSYTLPDQSGENTYVQLSDFPELDLLPHQTVEYYYEALLAASAENPIPTQHQNWPKPDELSSPEREVATINLKRLMHQLAQQISEQEKERYGDTIVAAILHLAPVKNPGINWRRLLRLYANSSSKTQVKSTIRRPSKRYGTVPGIRIRRKSKLIVAIDTSGSLTQRAFQAFFGEIHALWKTGHEIIIVESDQQIQRHFIYRGHIPQWVQGRGGTSFDPAIEWADEQNADLLVYFTDGYGPSPKFSSNIPIIWAIDEAGIHEQLAAWQQLPGRKLKLTA